MLGKELIPFFFWYQSVLICGVVIHFSSEVVSTVTNPGYRSKHAASVILTFRVVPNARGIDTFW